MSKVPIRDVSPIVQYIRNFLLGRKHTLALRFEQFVAPRTTGPPNLPDGPAHKLADNNYLARDARREVFPPVVLAGPELAGKIEAGTEAKEAKPTVKVGRTPGYVYNWD